MIFVNDKKYACETCIKGHRSSSCQHTERALFEIKKKGRPVTQCDHCRELRKTKQVHVRCSCETKPDTTAAPKQPGKKGSRLPAEAAYPNGLSPSLTGVATSPAPKPVEKCVCADGESCHCCFPRKKQPAGHTPPPGHSPNNPHPHVHHQHAYAPYTRPVRHQNQMMYRVGPCACGTNCVCPDCAQHRQTAHSHSNAQGTSMNQPFQGHGGDPCPVRCGNCFDCAGGLTLLLDPSVQSFESEQFTTSNGSFVSSYSQSQTYLGQNGIPQTNGIASQAGNGMGPTVNVVGPQGNAMPQSNGAVPVGAPAYYPPPDVEMDEFNAAMAGLDAGIAESSPSPSACGCPPGQCTCANVHQHPQQPQGEGNYWDRPRCGFAVSTERGGCDGMVSEVGSELGVGSDAGLGVGSDGMGVGSDAGIGSDAGSVVGGSTNLSMDFADLGFGGLELPPMQYDQRFSGEYYRDSGHFSHHRADSGQFTHHRESSQFSNHSNISLPSSIDSASVSLASLASSHGISSLASSHGIPSSHGIITPHSSPLSGRITPNRQNGRLTPHAKPTPRGYRRILPKVAAMTNHRPFRRHPRPQPSLHAVMESDVSPVGAGPGQSQVLLQGGPGPRVRGSVRAHLPIVGKYFQPGGRYEPSRFRNAQQMLQMQQMQAAMQQAGLQPGPEQYQSGSDQYQQSPQAYSAPPSESDYDGSYSPQYADEEAFGSFAEEEEDMYNEDGQAYEYQQQQQQQQQPQPQPQQPQQQPQQQYGYHSMGQYGGAEPGPAYQSVPMPVRQSTLVPQSMAVLPVQAMVGGMAYVPQQYSIERPAMPLQHSSSTATPDDAPPSPKQKVSSGLGMPHTMSLPVPPADAGMSHNPRGTLDDVDIKPGVPKDGQGPGGKKSRWPSFSVHGHRVMVGAKVMGAAYAAR